MNYYQYLDLKIVIIWMKLDIAVGCLDVINVINNKYLASISNEIEKIVVI